MTMQLSLPLKTAALAAIAMSLVACNRNTDNMSAGERLDSTVASAEQRTDQVAASAQQGMSELRQDVQAAGNRIAATAEDASITAGVNAELAKDPQLSALKIDVDTSNGHVVLNGQAPDAESRERATRLAANVKGVTNVDNNLEVRS
ncbi:MAG: BON domain-containing protein [Candidatus Dactylopiibacterium sp.]|nr:BON domain-containing protein [Candidatus Dactylopiibacterium sp.]